MRKRWSHGDRREREERESKKFYVCSIQQSHNLRRDLLSLFTSPSIFLHSPFFSHSCLPFLFSSIFFLSQSSIFFLSQSSTFFFSLAPYLLFSPSLPSFTIFFTLLSILPPSFPPFECNECTVLDSHLLYKYVCVLDRECVKSWTQRYEKRGRERERERGRERGVVMDLYPSQTTGQILPHSSPFQMIGHFSKE